MHRQTTGTTILTIIISTFFVLLPIFPANQPSILDASISCFTAKNALPPVILPTDKDNKQAAGRSGHINNQTAGPRADPYLSQSITTEPLYSLGDLFLLDKLFDSHSSILEQEGTTLGDLIILDQLFNTDNSLFQNGKKLNLGELVVLDRLCNSSPILKKDMIGLGDLFILDQLFNGSF